MYGLLDRICLAGGFSPKTIDSAQQSENQFVTLRDIQNRADYDTKLSQTIFDMRQLATS